jgi:hypothetical protein
VFGDFRSSRWDGWEWWRKIVSTRIARINARIGTDVRFGGLQGLAPPVWSPDRSWRRARSGRPQADTGLHHT